MRHERLRRISRTRRDETTAIGKKRGNHALVKNYRQNKKTAKGKRVFYFREISSLKSTAIFSSRLCTSGMVTPCIALRGISTIPHGRILPLR